MRHFTGAGIGTEDCRRYKLLTCVSSVTVQKLGPRSLLLFSDFSGAKDREFQNAFPRLKVSESEIVRLYPVRFNGNREKVGETI